MAITTYLSLITLSVSELNAPIKIHRMAGWIKKEKNLSAANKRVTSDLKTHTHGLKVKGWKKIFHANGNDKKLGVVILVSDKTDIFLKSITKDEHFTQHWVLEMCQLKMY